MNNVDVKVKHLKMIIDILQSEFGKSPKAKVYAFGSRVKHAARKFSDLDLAIDNNGEKCPSIVMRLRGQFMDSDLPFKVDVIDLNGVSQSFYDAIKADLTPLDAYIVY